MKEKIEQGRRKFLRNVFTATVLTASCPHAVLGQIRPEVSGGGDDEILGNYRVSLNEFPVLKDEWGSIRMEVRGIPPEWMYPNIIITKLPFEQYKKHYSCVEDRCPHEGYNVYDLDNYREFECSGHGTIFTCEGTYLEGPAAQDLTIREVFYDGGDQLTVGIPSYIATSIDNNEEITYLGQNMPNPCVDKTTIEYSLETGMYVAIDLIGHNGVSFMTIISENQSAGIHRTTFDVSGLPVGTYFYRMKAGNHSPITRKLLKIN